MSKDNLNNVQPLSGAPNFIQEINAEFVMHAPFFAEFLYRFHYKISEDVPSVGVAITDRGIEMALHPTWLESLPPEVQKGVLIHEILHLITESHARFSNLGKGSNFQIFNVASDICINEQILKSTIRQKPIQLPKEGCFLKMIKDEGYEGELVTECIYDWLMKKQKEIQCQGPGSNDSSNANDEDSNDGDGKKKVLRSFDDHSQLGSNSSEIGKAIIKEITAIAQNRGFGNVGGGMEDFVEKLTNPTINWKQVLRGFVRSTSVGNMVKSYTWKRYNRRNLPLPGKQKHATEFVVAIDTSGSVSNEELEKFFAEIDKLSTFAKIRLLQCDVVLVDSGIYKRGDWKKIKIAGRGGTILNPIFDYMNENKLTKNRLIVFTDGGFDYDFNTHKIQTLWVLTKNSGCMNDMQQAFPNHKFTELD